MQINGIGSQNTQTSSVYIYPKTQDNTITGYTYTYQLTVTVKNLTSSLLSQVLDTATAAGGNDLRINSVSVQPHLSDMHQQIAFVCAIWPGINTGMAL